MLYSKTMLQIRKKKVDDKINVPVISCAEDLSGKLVEHLCLIDSEEEEKRWVKGVVLEKYGKSNHLIRYHEKEDRLFSRNVFADYNNNKLKILSVSYKNFIGGSIKHMYEDSKSKENIWWDAEVVDVDMDSADMDNPDFFIIYKDSSDDIIDFSKIKDSDYFLEPLVNDYLNGCVKFISVDTDPIDVLI